MMPTSWWPLDGIGFSDKNPICQDNDKKSMSSHWTTWLNPFGAARSLELQTNEGPSSKKIETQPTKNEDGNANEGLATTVLVTTGVATGSAVVGTAAATAGLTATGFTASGVAAGSIAAGVQSSIGNVVAGSMFAGLQSLGATGGFAVLGPVGLATGDVGGGIYLGVKYYKYSKGTNVDEMPNKHDGRKPEEVRCAIGGFDVLRPLVGLGLGAIGGGIYLVTKIYNPNGKEKNRKYIFFFNLIHCIKPEEKNVTSLFEMDKLLHGWEILHQESVAQ